MNVLLRGTTCHAHDVTLHGILVRGTACHVRLTAADVKRVAMWWAGVEAWMSENLPEVIQTLNVGKPATPPEHTRACHLFRHRNILGHAVYSAARLHVFRRIARNRRVKFVIGSETW